MVPGSVTDFGGGLFFGDVVDTAGSYLVLENVNGLGVRVGMVGMVCDSGYVPGCFRKQKRQEKTEDSVFALCQRLNFEPDAVQCAVLASEAAAGF